MKLFKNSQVKQSSFDAFKSSASAIDDAAALEKITGGVLSGCHPVGQLASGLNLSRVSAASFNISALI